MRQAFTMIELIFVIVILGILSAVAIPRLNATREDAKTSRLASMVMTGASEIATYAMANGHTDSNFSVMSNNLDNLLKSGEAVVIAPKDLAISHGGVSNCIEIDINTTATVETLNILKNGAGTSILCDSLQSAIHAEAYPMMLRGESVVR